MKTTQFFLFWCTWPEAWPVYFKVKMADVRYLPLTQRSPMRRSVIFYLLFLKILPSTTFHPGRTLQTGNGNPSLQTSMPTVCTEHFLVVKQTTISCRNLGVHFHNINTIFLPCQSFVLFPQNNPQKWFIENEQAVNQCVLMKIGILHSWGNNCRQGFRKLMGLNY